VEVFLETERLRLRRFTSDDVDKLVELDSDPKVMRYINGGRPTPRDEVENGVLPRILSQYERFDGLGQWAAEEKSSSEFLGWFALHPRDESPPGDLELGYRLRRSAWGKGYATEGSRALIDKAFRELGAERVRADAMTVNVASRRVMEKSGMKYVRTFHLEWPEEIEGTAEGDVEYVITRSEWSDEFRRVAGS
jgi:RimJ/RimL family protein N-acetyltransferase